MIKYSQNEANKEDIFKLIEEENINMEASLTFQKELNAETLSYLQKFLNENPIENTANASDNLSDFFSNISKALKKSSANISKLENLKELLENITTEVTKSKNVSSENLKTKISEYNKKLTDSNRRISVTTSEINAFISKCKQDDIYKKIVSSKKVEHEIQNTTQTDNKESTSTLKLEQESKKTSVQGIEQTNCFVQNKEQEKAIRKKQSRKEKKKQKKQALKNNNTSADSKSNSESETAKSTSENIAQLKDNSKLTENTLIISEKNDNVILPYTIEELQQYIKNSPNSYTNLQDVVEKEFTRPINYYKNSAVARFKETFKLVRERNNGSFKHALDLSLESFFNHNLHPAIISACKTIDELDIYLSCLEFDELEDFKFFKIVFDIMPKLSSKKNEY